MSPLDRVQARAAAFDALGLSESATPQEVRAAWRRIAFELHPDREGGDLAEFLRVQEAYDLLRDGGEGASAPRATRATSRPSNRPRVRSRTVPIGAAAKNACWAHLAEEALKGEDGRTDQAHAPVPDGQDAPGKGHHVPEAVDRQGRSLTYIVPTPLAQGLNRVALPTALLDDNRRIDPQVVTVRSSSGGAGEITIPDHLRTRLFPGARQVQIRFGMS